MIVGNTNTNTITIIQSYKLSSINSIMRSFKQFENILTEATPTGAEYESIIAVGYNQGKPPYNSSKAKDSGAFSTASKFLPKNSEKPYNDTAYKLGRAMRSMTSGKMTQYGGKSPSVSPLWNKITGKSVDTAKTDVMTTERISLKKKGGSQLMSGGKAESIATLTAALEMVGENKKISSIINKIDKGFKRVMLDGNKTDFIAKKDNFAKMKPSEYKAKADEFLKVDEMHQKLNKMISPLLEKDADLKQSIVYIATTGYKKFPNGSNGIANRLIEFDPNKGIITHNIKTGSPSKMSSSIKNMASATTFYCGFKTSKKNPYSTLRTRTSKFEEHNPTLNGLIIETLMKDLNMNYQSLLTEGYAFFTEENIIEGLLDKAAEKLKSLGRSIKNWFSNIVSKIIEGATKVFDKIVSLGKRAFEMLFNFLGLEMINASVRISGIAGTFANK